MRKHIAVIVMSLCATMLMAQIPQSTKEAARLYQEKKYEEAKTQIDQSVAEDGKENAYSWHVRGHIYKEIYKQVDKFDRNSKAREQSVLSFQNSMNFDAEGEYKEWNRTSLKFLASKYWNDAVNIIDKADVDNLPEAEKYYELYKNTLATFESGVDQEKVTLDFFKAYATSNRKTIEKQRNMGAAPETYAEVLERVKKSYEEALKVNPEDYGSNYNLAINLYNEAAYRIERIPSEADLTFLLLEQQGCIEIFKEALPYAVKAYDQKPGRIEILKAQRAIHLSLSNYDEFEKYDGLIKQKQGEIGAPNRDLNSLRDQGKIKMDR